MASWNRTSFSQCLDPYMSGIYWSLHVLYVSLLLSTFLSAVIQKLRLAKMIFVVKDVEDVWRNIVYYCGFVRDGCICLLPFVTSLVVHHPAWIEWRRENKAEISKGTEIMSDLPFIERQFLRIQLFIHCWVIAVLIYIAFVFVFLWNRVWYEMN